MCAATAYRRPSIPVRPAADVVALPSRFRVRVHKRRLVGMVLRELLAYRGDVAVALSRPCVYGVFSGPLGGLRPREGRCVGCLRCTVQYPDVVRIERNPNRDLLGDPYLPPEHVDTLLYEARTGRVPVSGAGYRGPFGGSGWDGMWLDMSEIVRPTRDGIHGREYIGTTVDFGTRPAFLCFDRDGEPQGERPRPVEIAVPYVFDAVGVPEAVVRVIAAAAARVGTVAVVPAMVAGRLRLAGPHVVPLLGDPATGQPRLCDDSGSARLTPRRDPEPSPGTPRMVALQGWDPARYEALCRAYPDAVGWVRIPADGDPVAPARAGVAVVHLVADQHGEAGGRFLADLVAAAHERLVAERIRDRVTIVASGGVVMADHVPKALACGADAVGLDTVLWAALQGAWSRHAYPTFPRFRDPWGIQRLTNVAVSWRDQLLEALGAMGLREARRLRGDHGRLMRQRELEREAFGGVPGYQS